MALQEREVNILAYLLRYKYMNSHQVKRVFFANQTDANMHRILRKLQSLKFIERIQFPRTPQTNLGSLLYLTPKGAKCLAAEWQVSIDELSYNRIVYPIQSTNHFAHRMHLVSFWMELDHALEDSNLEIKHLRTEFHKKQSGGVYITESSLYSRCGKVKLIPDICFILRNPEKQAEVVYFVEIDTGKETIRGRMKKTRPGSLLEKYRNYEYLLLDGGWKDDLSTSAEAFIVLTITNHKTHIQNVQNKCKELLEYPEFFLFTTHDQVVNRQLLVDSIWNDLNGNQRALIKR